MKLRVYNDTLDPNIWNEDKSLKPDVKDALLKIAEDFYHSTDLVGEIQNILFLGSVANYNWTPTSDIDLHIVIDIAGEKINEEYARKFMDGLALKWNTDHDIEIGGHPVEVYIQDVREPNSTVQQARPNVAIYSIFDDKWMLEPDKLKIDLDADKIREKYQTLKKKIKNLVETEDIEKLKDLMKSIRNYRDAGLAKGGEFSVENLVFKALRHTGELKTMKDAINTIYDKKVSLPEDGNIQPDKKTEPLNEVILKYGQLIIGLMDGNEVTNVEINTKGNHHGQGIRWRYKYPYPVMFWWENPTDDQKNILTDYFKDKFNIVIKEHLVGFNCGFRNANDGIKTFNALHVPHILGLYRAKSKIKEGLVDKNAKLFLGFIKRDNLKVVGTAIDNEEFCHTDFQMELGGEWTSLYDTEFIPWRYKKSTNSVYWWVARAKPTEDEKREVEYWIEKNVRARYPDHKWLSNFVVDLQKNRDDAHSIDENDGKPFLVVGNVNDDLEIKAEIDYEGATRYWSNTPVIHNWPGGVDWRYKSKTNTINWRVDEEEVTEQHKDAVIEYLYKKFSITSPTNKYFKDDVEYQSHYVNESLSDFIIIGCINDELEMLAEKDFVGTFTHQKLLTTNQQYHYIPQTIVLWRYKSTGNTLYWGDGVNSKQREVVLEYLKMAGIENPRQSSMYASPGTFDNAHRVNEMVSLVKLFTTHPLLIKKSKKE